MAIYQNFEQMKSDFPFFYSGNPSDIKLFIKGNDVRKRKDACNAVKSLLEGIFESSRLEGEIQDYEVRVIDLLKETDPSLTSGYGQFWDRMGDQKGKVFVPIFHNVGSNSNLPQTAWDSNAPGIFSLTEKEYLSVVNVSKRDCHSILIIK